MSKKSWGFTLAELLSALAILGVIATFTIPKVLNATSNSQWNSTTKEMAAMVTQAYSAYRLNNTPSSTTVGADITPYMNYVRVDTASAIDNRYGQTGTVSCTGNNNCLVLHNGGYLMYGPTRCFYGTTNKHAWTFDFDPDGKVTGDSTDANGPGKRIIMFLYFDGRVTSSNFVLDDTISGGAGCGFSATYQPGDLPDPDWFEW